MEKGLIKIRRCTIVLDVKDYYRKGGDFLFKEAEIKLEQIPAEYTKDYFYHVGDILKSKKGKVFYKTTDKISGDI